MSATKSRLRVDRWSGGLAGAVALSVAGVLKGSTVLFVAATIPVAYVVYGALDRVDLTASDLAIERDIDRTSAFPGDRIDVSVRVTNEGDRPLADLRVADVVPESISVVDGQARDGMALRPGETGTLAYTLVARRGDHEFGPVRVRARSTSGTDVVTLDVTPDGTNAIHCRPDLETVPLARQTRQFAGSVGTDSGGSGVEFHSTRDYRRGDPVSRIDWRRFAKAGDLTTVNYREHRTARVVVAVDARDPCYVAPVPGAPTGAAMCGYGARRVYEVLRAAGHEVGATAFGIRDSVGGAAWVEPGTDDETRIRARELYERAAETPGHLDPDRQGASGRHSQQRSRRGDGRPSEGTRRRSTTATADGGRRGERRRERQAPEGRDRRREGRPGRNGHRPPREQGPPERSRRRERPSKTPRREDETRVPERGRNNRRGNRRPERPDDQFQATDPVDTLCGRLSPNTQLLFFTPAVDEFPEEVVETVIARGHRATVVSPDVTVSETTGGRIESVERQLLLERLRETGATVVDWERDRPLALTLASVLEGI